MGSAPLVAQDSAAQQAVAYELKFPNAVHHEAEIAVTFSGVTSPRLEVLMSRSSPGRYALHEFAKNVYSVRAHDGAGKSLAIDRPNPYEWDVATIQASRVVVEYTLFGDYVDGTYAAIDETHAHLNMPATLMWARAFEKAPVTVRFDRGNRDWDVATQLSAGHDGLYTAPSLDRLMDSPAELSRHARPEWDVDGRHYILSLHHQGTDAEADHLAKLGKAVVTEEAAVFGELPKYDGGPYTFLLDLLPWAGGDGMEHRDSTVITGKQPLSQSYDQAIGTMAHEFFHSWNVKRIRPKTLEPFDYERVNMSGELWFAEGFTNYYGPLSLERAGIIDRAKFFEEMSKALTVVTTAPGRELFSAVDMSRQAGFVDAATANDPVNRVNTFISYYTYGEALGFGIDLAIRGHFPGKSLDDWMRVMWREHGDADRPYTLADLEQALGEAVGDASFAHMIFEHHILGKEPIPYSKLLAAAGFVLGADSTKPDSTKTAWLGPNKFTYDQSGVEITTGAVRGTPLYVAGLDKGDRITSWNGKSLTSEAELTEFLGQHKAGDKLKLQVNTRSGSKDVMVVAASSPALAVKSFEESGMAVTPQVEAFRKAWLGSKVSGHSGAGSQ